MAKKQRDKQRRVAEPEAPGEEPSSSADEADASSQERALASADAADEPGADSDSDEPSDSAGEPTEGADGPEGDEPDEEALSELSEEEQAAGQLGVERYVLAGFFAAGMLATYVLGRTVSGVWATLANKEWFAQAVPSLAAIPDDSKGTYATIVAAVISLVVTYRIYKRPDMRAWSAEVAAELTKVKWPTKKEVSSSTTIVIIASLLATAYLTVLDRLYAFVTNIVYGNGT